MFKELFKAITLFVVIIGLIGCSTRSSRTHTDIGKRYFKSDYVEKRNFLLGKGDKNQYPYRIKFDKELTKYHDTFYTMKDNADENQFSPAIKAIVDTVKIGENVSKFAPFYLQDPSFNESRMPLDDIFVSAVFIGEDSKVTSSFNERYNDPEFFDKPEENERHLISQEPFHIIKNIDFKPEQIPDAVAFNVVNGRMFTSGNLNINSEAIAVLERIVKAVKAHPEMKLYVSAYDGFNPFDKERLYQAEQITQSQVNNIKRLIRKMSPSVDRRTTYTAGGNKKAFLLAGNDHTYYSRVFELYKEGAKFFSYEGRNIPSIRMDGPRAYYPVIMLSASVRVQFLITKNTVNEMNRMFCNKVKKPSQHKVCTPKSSE